MPDSTRKWLDLLHPDDRERLRTASIEAGVKGTRVDVEYRLQRPDGAWMHMRQVIEPMPGQSVAAEPEQIGRASCRERVEITGGAVRSKRTLSRTTQETHTQ